MLVSVPEVRLKSDFMLIYLDTLVSSTVRAYVYACPTCTDAHVRTYVQIRAVNAGLLHHKEGGLIPCTESLCENYWVLASVSRSRRR